MTRYFIEPRTKKYKNNIDFSHSQEIYPKNMKKYYWILLQKQDQMLQKMLSKK